jgi:hypothetical protein
VQPNYPSGSKPAPRKVASLKDVKPASAADVNNSQQGRPAVQPSKADVNTNIHKNQQPVQSSKPAPPAKNHPPVNYQQEPAHTYPQKNSNNVPPPVNHHHPENVNHPQEVPHHSAVKQQEQSRPKEEKGNDKKEK